MGTGFQANAQFRKMVAVIDFQKRASFILIYITSVDKQYCSTRLRTIFGRNPRIFSFHINKPGSKGKFMFLTGPQKKWFLYMQAVQVVIIVGPFSSKRSKLKFVKSIENQACRYFAAYI